jgi:hypothetical protein
MASSAKLKRLISLSRSILIEMSNMLELYCIYYTVSVSSDSMQLSGQRQFTLSKPASTLSCFR